MLWSKSFLKNNALIKYRHMKKKYFKNTSLLSASASKLLLIWQTFYSLPFEHGTFFSKLKVHGQL